MYIHYNASQKHILALKKYLWTNTPVLRPQILFRQEDDRICILRSNSDVLKKKDRRMDYASTFPNWKKNLQYREENPPPWLGGDWLYVPLGILGQAWRIDCIACALSPVSWMCVVRVSEHCAQGFGALRYPHVTGWSICAYASQLHSNLGHLDIKIPWDQIVRVDWLEDFDRLH